jgi:aspartate kinase
MAIVVKKFGGSSVSDIPKIKNIAKRIFHEKSTDDSVVVVISAMGNTTNNLFNLATQISLKPSQRELDMLVTAGERISMSLLSLALQENGLSAISFTGSQSGIITDIHHGAAKIINVKAFRILNELEKGKIVIVAGYQGISTLKEVTTLGRGGSDTTAVALACYLNAAICEIFTDVKGVFTADPRIVKNAIFIPKISYKEMLAMAYTGAKVIHPRAVEFAYKYKINVEIKSSFENKQGTFIVDKNINEIKNITAITTKKNICRLNIKANINDSLFLFNLFSNEGLELINYKFTDEFFTILIDEFLQSHISEMLSKNNYKFVLETNFHSISFIGSGISQNSIFIRDMIDYFLKKKKCKMIDLIPQEVSLSFIIKTELLDEILIETHNFIFNNGVRNDR